MSNKRFGYARVSTTDQNEDRQVLELLESGIEERDIYAVSYTHLTLPTILLV